MHHTILDIAQKIDSNIKLVVHNEQQTLLLDNDKSILNVLKELKENENTSFDMLIDITAIDWLKEQNRFELVYFLYSNKFKNRVRIKIPIDDITLIVPTSEQIFPSANWYEREVWDMYGIKFDGHSDLRRFYMPEDFFNQETGETYHPLRKDFPLTGIPDSLPLPPFPERTGKEVEF